MLWILCHSSITILHPARDAKDNKERSLSSGTTYKHPQLALPQLALALMALTSFHVQIINRLASGYPMWYMTIASWIIDSATMTQVGKSSSTIRYLVYVFIMYPVVQGILYANFLPPA